MREAIRKVNGNSYKYGTGPELLYAASGLIDDESTSAGAFGFCYELVKKSGGFNPSPSTIKPVAKEALQGFYAAIEWASESGPQQPATAIPTPMPTRGSIASTPLP